ncbi:hypothetical protein [Methylomonas sp. MgM2]
MNFRSLLFVLILVFLSSFETVHASDDTKIRQIVEHMLHEKNTKIEQLENHVRQLERKLDALTQASVHPEPTSAPNIPNPTPIDVAQTHPNEPAQTADAKSDSDEGGISTKLHELGKTVGELKAAVAEKGLEISGFFDVNAKTANSTNQIFSVGSLELDLDYVHDAHFGAASALVLCGNSYNADYGAPAAVFCGSSGPGGLSGGNTMAGIAVAMIDYHLYDPGSTARPHFQ